ncbi:UDP-2,3-diacylglucosamine diphosphatase [Arsenophonus symbiont of Ornithomya chloropus]|uniref:UDP-2,3-diacylglucosamine diphosphatase n=1 Tax=Arsenophonus symbiont of Ornithomya chloropus TaxID=634121 RepID=UPI0032B16EB8
MEILFIADLHLHEKKTNITIGFLRFLKNQAIQAQALYILGDFFHYWIGDDDPNILHKAIAHELKKLYKMGIRCYFIHGNRDFLLGKRFAKKSGMILLPKEKVIQLYGHQILILHGDLLCTDDISYQRYRKRVCKRWLQKLFLDLPLSIRHFLAKKIRKNSQSLSLLKQKHITDVNEKTVIEKFKKYQVDWIIHGHTHQPAIHKLKINGKILHRGVLGAWQKNGSAIRITNKTIELINFALY